VRINIIMEKDDPDRSTGRAFVEFETADAASTCAKELIETASSVHGRIWLFSAGLSGRLEVGIHSLICHSPRLNLNPSALVV
jgi:RNA recognition motif-containing protein